MLRNDLIAVVDDDESVLESLPPLLRSFGYAVEAFPSAEGFLAAPPPIHAARCLILDIAMPGMRGPELQEELKRRGLPIPIVFITAHSEHELGAALMRKGAVACLQKPFSEEALLRAIRSALELGESESRVVVVDDDISVRESLDALLRATGHSVECYATAREFLSRPASDAPTCLVLDVELPDLNGLELQQRLAEHGAAIPIVFITGYGDIPMSVRAIKGGAVEFLTKPYSDATLLGAVNQALEHSRSTRRERAEMQALRDCYGSLTPREKEVMALVVSGLLNKQVAAELGTSEITVKTHRGSVMRKMNASSLADLVRKAGSLKIPLHPQDR